MDPITFQNKRGETYGVANGLAFLTDPGVALAGDLSPEALRRAKATIYACAELQDAKLHDDATRTVTLVIRNGVRPTDVSLLRVDTFDPDAQRAFAAAIVAHMRPTKQSQQSSLWTDLLGPLICGPFVLLVGGLVYADASDMAGGTFRPTERLGKAGSRGRLIESMAEALGATGAIAVFGALFLLCVAWLVYVVRAKHTVTRWRVA